MRVRSLLLLSVLLAAAAAAPESRFELGQFALEFSGPTMSALTITARNSTVLWQSPAGLPFISSFTSQEGIRQESGFFVVKESGRKECLDAEVESILPTGNSVQVFGGLCAGTLAFQVAFSIASTNQLSFRARLVTTENSPAGVRRLVLHGSVAADESVFGMGQLWYGERGLNGERFPVFTREKGAGHGLQPLTDLLNIFHNGGGGWKTFSYFALPHFVATRPLRSFFLTNFASSEFDFGKSRPGVLSVEVNGTVLEARLVAAASPLEHIGEYTAWSGRMAPLPEWAVSGAIVGLTGGTDAVMSVVKRLRTEAPNAPIAGVWMQDWSGQRDFGTRIGLWWQWSLDESLYHSWPQLVSSLEAEGIRVLTYANPMLADVTKKQPPSKINLFNEAKQKGYLVKQADGNVWLGYNGAGLLDFTNPAARTWYKSLLKTNLLGIGARGFMADFGEALPLDAQLFSGEDAATYHNRYPSEWQRVCAEAVAEAGLEGQVVYFSRAGNSLSPNVTSLFWLGDQLVTWDEYDGIKTAVVGMLSTGLSGYTLTHSDIGGYTMIDASFGSFNLSYARSKELLLRWCELSAFTSVYRSHPGSIPHISHQFYSDSETLQHYARFARVYASWKDYRVSLMAEAASRGWPLVRPLWLHYPAAGLHDVKDEYLIGTELLVRPVLDPGQREVSVVLPPGRWVHAWTGNLYGDDSRVTTVTVAAPIGSPAVFGRDTALGRELVARIRAL